MPPEWFEVDRQPWDSCPACKGDGFIGHFPNGKVIPCPCIFASHARWAAAMVKQRELGRSVADKGLNKIRRNQ
ncbi:MAG: hypothetical protein ABFE07_29345 [Armatimonadia bacterium]